MKEKLEEAARDPAGERVRVEAQDLIGTVKLIEEGEHIIAELEGARLLMQGGTTHVTHGAQEAACMLRHRIDLRRQTRRSFDSLPAR